MEDHSNERSFLLMLLKDRVQFEVGKNIAIIEDEIIFVMKKLLELPDRTAGTENFRFMGDGNPRAQVRLMCKEGLNRLGEMVGIDSHLFNPSVLQMGDDEFEQRFTEYGEKRLGQLLREGPEPCA